MAQRSPDQQAKPLAPAAYRIASDYDHQSLSIEFKEKLQQRKCMIQCCGCITALLLILAVIFLVLIFTVFHVTDPSIKVNAIDVQNLKLENGTIRSGVNVTLVADVSVKNSNYASFRYDNATTIVYYRGAVIGEGMTPSGQVKKRRTLEMNMTVDVAVSGLSSYVSSGALNLSSYTRINGRVKIFKSKLVVAKMNCTMSVNVTSQVIQYHNCNRHVSL